MCSGEDTRQSAGDSGSPPESREVQELPESDPPAAIEYPQASCRSIAMARKKQLRVTALNGRQEGGEEQEVRVKSTPKLPFDTSEDCRLLGLQLDEHWSFRSHIEDVRQKMRGRMTILRRLSSLNWGLETRVLAITAHAVMESLIGYGLT